ncbi:MAG: hypothetical protein WCB19_01755 [Thermoplasmata archaeon]
MIDTEGLHLDYGPAKTRTFLWKNSKWWFVLLDWREQIRTDKDFHSTGPFSMTRVGMRGVWLTEDTGKAIIKGAEVTGVKVKSHVSGIPRTNLRPMMYTEETSLYR